MKEEKINFRWLKSHADTIVVLGGVLTAMIWMNNTMNSFKEEIRCNMIVFESRLSQIEKDIAIIKTVLIMKDMMPKELAYEKAE